ncbi:MAG: glycosyltransferase family 4 protein [bacterium]|nr:glycosyltransferase family 4 protein [bacterium]
MSARLGYLCSSESWGGLEMNHLRNAVWMHQRGHKVLVITVKDSRFAQEAEAAHLNVAYIEKHSKYYDFKNGRVLVKILKQQGITHILIRATRDMSITAFAKWKLKNALHTSYFMEMQLGVKKTHFLHARRHNEIDLWSCPLPWLEEQVKTMTRFKNTIVQIPSGMDLSQFHTVPSKEDARAALQLPQNVRIFGLMGRFDPQKGQLLLLKAMKEAKNKDFHVVLLGEPTHNEAQEYYAEMLDIIQSETFKKRVHVRPYMKNPVTFYNAIDWFVMATKAESIGMVTMESLACGTPVLGSNAGGTPEILEHEKGGVLFETQNVQSLAEKIDTICSENITRNPQVLREMTQQYDHNSVCAAVESALGLR